MAVALGEGEVKTVEDLAGLVPDDLRGWFETKDGERVREPGVLESFNLSPEDAEALIMRARVAAGWIEPEPELEEPRTRPMSERRKRSSRTRRSPATEEIAGRLPPLERGTRDCDTGCPRSKTGERRDIVSGEVMDEARLIRFVAGAGRRGDARPGAQAAGAGLWVAADRAAVETAAQARALSRARPRPSSRPPPDLADQVERLLATATVSSGLGLARRAGDLTLGFEKVGRGV